MNEKEEVSFVKWFSELNKNSGSIAGGKGAVSINNMYHKWPNFVMSMTALNPLINPSLTIFLIL